MNNQDLPHGQDHPNDGGDSERIVKTEKNQEIDNQQPQPNLPSSTGLQDWNNWQGVNPTNNLLPQMSQMTSNATALAQNQLLYGNRNPYNVSGNDLMNFSTGIGSSFNPNLSSLQFNMDPSSRLNQPFPSIWPNMGNPFQFGNRFLDTHFFGSIPRKKRQPYSKYQIRQLEQEYNSNKFISRQKREQISRELRDFL